MLTYFLGKGYWNADSCWHGGGRCQKSPKKCWHTLWTVSFTFILKTIFNYFLLPSKREFSKSDLSSAPLIPLDPQESFNCLALFNCLLKIKELSSNKVRTSSIQPGNWKTIWNVFFGKSWNQPQPEPKSLGWVRSSLNQDWGFMVYVESW